MKITKITKTRLREIIAEEAQKVNESQDPVGAAEAFTAAIKGGESGYDELHDLAEAFGKDTTEEPFYSLNMKLEELSSINAGYDFGNTKEIIDDIIEKVEGILKSVAASTDQEQPSEKPQRQRKGPRQGPRKGRFKKPALTEDYLRRLIIAELGKLSS